MLHSGIYLKWSPTESCSEHTQERQRRKNELLWNEHGHSRLSLLRAKCRIFYVSSFYQVFADVYSFTCVCRALTIYVCMCMCVWNVLHAACMHTYISSWTEHSLIHILKRANICTTASDLVWHWWQSYSAVLVVGGFFMDMTEAQILPAAGSGIAKVCLQMILCLPVALETPCLCLSFLY